MSSTASIFWGLICTYWSLLRAAVAWKPNEKPLLAMNLLIARKVNGTLLSSVTTTGLQSCPLEVFYLIQDQVHALADIESVTVSWQREFLKDLFMDADNDSEESLNPEHSPHILNSREFEEWAEKRASAAGFGGFYDEWTWSDYGQDHCKEQLYENEHPLIEEFLASFGFKMLKSHPGRMDDVVPGNKYDSKLEQILIPIFARLAHPEPEGVHIEGWNDNELGQSILGVQDLNLSAFTRPAPAPKSFNIFYEKYYVEFVRPPFQKEAPQQLSNRSVAIVATIPTTQPGASSGTEKERREKEEFRKREQGDLLSKPEPRWMLWADGDW